MSLAGAELFLGGTVATLLAVPFANEFGISYPKIDKAKKKLHMDEFNT